MAKINEQDTPITIIDLAQLRRDGWISTETGEDALIGLAIKTESVERGESGDVEITDPDTGATAIIDFEVTREGLVDMALRARCECGNPWSLCHPDA